MNELESILARLMALNKGPVTAPVPQYDFRNIFQLGREAIAPGANFTPPNMEGLREATMRPTPGQDIFFSRPVDPRQALVRSIPEVLTPEVLPPEPQFTHKYPWKYGPPAPLSEPMGTGPLRGHQAKINLTSPKSLALMAVTELLPLIYGGGKALIRGDQSIAQGVKSQLPNTFTGKTAKSFGSASTGDVMPLIQQMLEGAMAGAPMLTAQNPMLAQLLPKLLPLLPQLPELSKKANTLITEPRNQWNPSSQPQTTQAQPVTSNAAPTTGGSKFSLEDFQNFQAFKQALRAPAQQSSGQVSPTGQTQGKQAKARPSLDMDASMVDAAVGRFAKTEADFKNRRAKFIPMLIARGHDPAEVNEWFTTGKVPGAGEQKRAQGLIDNLFKYQQQLNMRVPMEEARDIRIQNAGMDRAELSTRESAKRAQLSKLLAFILNPKMAENAVPSTKAGKLSGPYVDFGGMATPMGPQPSRFNPFANRVPPTPIPITLEDLTQITRGEGIPSGSTVYQYDAQGRRIQ